MEYVKSDGVSISRCSETEREKTPWSFFECSFYRECYSLSGPTLSVKSTTARLPSLWELGRKRRVGEVSCQTSRPCHPTGRAMQERQRSTCSIPARPSRKWSQSRRVPSIPSKPSPLTGLPTFPARDLLAIFHRRTLNVAALVSFIFWRAARFSIWRAKPQNHFLTMLSSSYPGSLFTD